MANKQGGSPKIGRAKRPGPKARRERYRERVWPVHKLRRVLLGNGYQAALAYATKQLWIGALNKLILSRPSWPAYCRPPKREAT